MPIDDNHMSERLAVVESTTTATLEAVREVARSHADTQRSVQDSIGRLSQIAAVQEERQKAATDAAKVKSVEVDRRLDDFGKASVDNLAQHSSLLQDIKDESEHRKTGDESLRKALSEIQTANAVSRGQNRVWLIVFGAIWTLIQKMPDILRFLHVKGF